MWSSADQLFEKAISERAEEKVNRIWDGNDGQCFVKRPKRCLEQVCLPAESGCAGSKYGAITIDSDFRPNSLPLGEDCDGHCGHETCLVLMMMTSQYILPRTAT